MAVIGVVAIAAPIVSGVITNASMKKQARDQNSKIQANYYAYLFLKS